MLYREDYSGLGAPVEILGVFRNTKEQTGLSAAKVRACFEEDVPLDPAGTNWRYAHAGNGLAAHWWFKAPTGYLYVIEAHVVEPLDAPPPRVGRRPRS